MIIEKIEESYATPENKNWDGVHASSAAKCIRALYYDATLDKETVIEPRIKRVFENGDFFHRRLMSVLFRLKDVRVVAGEIKVPANEFVRGTCDAIIGLEDENFVLDFKSINDSGFKFLKAPKQEHVIQLGLYIYYFKLKRGLIIYESKDNQELKEFLIDITDPQTAKLLDDTFTKIGYLTNCIKSKTLPTKPEFDVSEQWRCNYCNYKEECAKNHNIQ